MNNLNLGCADTTNGIKKDFVEKNSSDTMIEKWIRNCPKCSKIVEHKTKRWRNRANKIKQVCSNCQKDCIRNFDKSRQCPSCDKTISYKFHCEMLRVINKPCQECSRKFRKYTASFETRLKISKNTKIAMSSLPLETKQIMLKRQSMSKNTPEYKRRQSALQSNRKASDETRKKHRISILKSIREKHGGVCPRYNPIACKFVDEYGKSNGYNFQHALNGGEFYIKDLGYFIDGYDSNKNVVFEYDEPHHFNSLNQLKDGDIKRMNEIKVHLNCKFIRYNEKLNEIKEY